MEDKIISKKDIYLILALLLIAGLACIFVDVFSKKGAKAVIMVSGEELLTVSANDDATYLLTEVEGNSNPKITECDADTDIESVIGSGDSGECLYANIIQIKDGKVSCLAANCPDRICVKHAEISSVGETIICLPHKLVIEIQE